MALLKALWRGEIALVKAYWIYGVLVQLIIFGIPEFIMQANDYEPKSLTAFAVLAVYGFVFTPVYKVFIFVAIWRSANNYEGRKIWSILAKIAIVFGIFLVVMEYMKAFQ